MCKSPHCHLRLYRHMISRRSGAGYCVKQVLAAALAVAALSGVALAAGYDDFTAAIAAGNRGDFDAAVVSYTAALKAGDLASPYIPTAHRMRGSAYLYQGKCREALADFEAVAALIPLDRVDFLSRARAKTCLGDFVGGKQDLEAAMGPVPEPSLYEALGRAQWHEGLFAGAAESFAKAVEFMPKNDFAHGAYVVLWYAIAADRAGYLDQVKLGTYVDALSSSDWPMPLLDLYRGTLKADVIHPTTRPSVAEKYAGQLCEADFYIAEWHIAHGGSDAAKPLIARAAAKCPHNFVEYGMAKVEAGRLGLPLPPEVKP